LNKQGLVLELQLKLSEVTSGSRGFYHGYIAPMTYRATFVIYQETLLFRQFNVHRYAPDILSEEYTRLIN
jgi:hypothetical protein|tara:strand:- start:258 stop:467 length:210 start_codon:yes stop_codon:yes gene_type:complete